MTGGRIKKKQTINVEQAKDIISCSRRHVYRLVESGQIRGYFIGNGRGLRIIRKSVEEYVDQKKEEFAIA